MSKNNDSVLLDEEEQQILDILAEHDGRSFSIEELTELLEISYTRVRYYVTELVHAELVTLNRRYSSYSLSHKGRGYLIENDLV